MANKLINWAIGLKLRPAHRGHVLLLMANYAGDECLAFLSLKRLCEETQLDRKTVIADLDWLCEMGIIRETGKKKGSTNRVKEYFLNIEIVPSTEWFRKRNGSVPPIEIVPFIPVIVPSIPINGSFNGTLNQKEPEGTQIEEPFMPEWLPKPEWEQFLIFRKRKAKGVPLSPYAQKIALSSLAKLVQSGEDPAEILNAAILRNWSGIFSLKNPTQGTSHAKPNSRTSSVDDAKQYYLDKARPIGQGEPVMWDANTIENGN